MRICIHRGHLYVIQELDPCHRDAMLKHIDYGINRVFDAVKCTHRRRHGWRAVNQIYDDLGDDAQGALRAHQQLRQVIAGSGFAGRAAGANEATVGHHCRQPQHVNTHGAAAYGRAA